MLIMPDAPPIYRILSIDPGSYNLGFALIDLDVAYRTATVVSAGTFYSKGAVDSYAFLSEIQGERFTRFHYLQQAVSNLLEQSQPQWVISEAPYLGKFLQAYETLVECLSMLRQEVYQYNPALPLETVDPPSVKKAVGASGRGKDKDMVRVALSQISKLHWRETTLATLDEHAVDAVAVGCYKIRCVSDDIL